MLRSNKFFFLTLLAGATLLLSSCSHTQTNSVLNSDTSPNQDDNFQNDQEVVPAQDSVQGQVGALTDSQYAPYDPIAVAAAAESGQAVLFFHANWCPTCRAAEKDITSNLSELPESITIFKTDYDAETELKEKYGVTYQHTFVQVDANGEAVTKWNGGSLNAVIERTQVP